MFIDKTWIINFKILDKKYNKLLLEKASISINGVSLTISKINQNFKTNVTIQVFSAPFVTKTKSMKGGWPFMLKTT